MSTKKIKLNIIGDESKSLNKEIEENEENEVSEEIETTEPSTPSSETNTPSGSLPPTEPETPLPVETNETNETNESNESIEVVEKKKKELKKNKNRDEQTSIFIPIMSETDLIFPINSIGKRLKENITKNVSLKYEGKCNNNGYIKSGSVRIINYSSGLICNGNIKFKIVYECFACNPVEGHKLEAKVKNVTKAGIRAEVNDGDDIPLVIFIARDHNYSNPYFLSIKENDSIVVRVVGSRYELNDTYIAIIGELVEPRKNFNKQKQKPRLKIKN